MSMIDRHWGCMNCQAVFQSYEPNPPCPSCGCVRVSWVPGKLNLGGSAPGIDKEVRTLSELYGMSDVNTPSVSRLDRAMPVTNRPAEGPVHHWGMGFASTWSPNGPTCVPCATQVTGKVTVGNPLTHSKSIDGPQAHTRIEARHIGASK